jgi:hypothetical protein
MSFSGPVFSLGPRERDPHGGRSVLSLLVLHAYGYETEPEAKAHLGTLATPDPR